MAALEKGKAHPEAFALKMLFTAITINTGFKGGEIVPTFFIGATFGYSRRLLGLDPSFGAAIGLVALFCGVVNCPVASILLSYELFGGSGLVLFAVACGVFSYAFKLLRTLFQPENNVLQRQSPNIST